MPTITYTMNSQGYCLATINMGQGVLHEMGFDDYPSFHRWLEINKAESVEGGWRVEEWKNYRGVVCNTCFEMLTGEELASYDHQWQYSGDMYCTAHRDCPDDCRRTPCLLERKEK